MNPKSSRRNTLWQMHMRRAVVAVGSLWIAILALLSAGARAEAQTYGVLYSFQCQPDGGDPESGLVRDGAGNLYGATASGGTYNHGTVFELFPDGTEAVLHSFSGGPADGEQPEHTALLLDPADNLYGVTPFGGKREGTVYRVAPDGTETILYNFRGGAAGGEPFGGLARDSAGNFYGTTYYGGDTSCNQGNGCGTVFKLSRSGQETVLYSFLPAPDGELPIAGLVRDGAGNLYGTTTAGGVFEGHGTAFELSPSGQESVLHEFTGGADGLLPSAPLIRDAAGNLYGTTEGGTTSSGGTVFEIPSAGQYIVLHSFTGRAGGLFPAGPLIRDAAGNLYGTTSDGGAGPCFDGAAYGCGVIFKVSSAGSEKALYSFEGSPDGAYPRAGLVRDAAGSLYGTTSTGGAYGCGTVFKFTP